MSAPHPAPGLPASVLIGGTSSALTPPLLHHPPSLPVPGCLQGPRLRRWPSWAGPAALRGPEPKPAATRLAFPLSCPSGHHLQGRPAGRGGRAKPARTPPWRLSSRIPQLTHHTRTHTTQVTHTPHTCTHHTHTHAHTPTPTHYVHIHTPHNSHTHHTCVHTHVHIHTHLHSHTLCTCTHTTQLTHTIHMYIYIPPHSHYIHIHTSDTLIYTTHMYTPHTHIHTCTHTHIPRHSHTHTPHTHTSILTPYIPHTHTHSDTLTHTTHIIPICTHTYVHHTYTCNTQHTHVTHMSPHSLTRTHSRLLPGSPGLLAATPEVSLPTSTRGPLAIRASGKEGTGAGAACGRPRSFSYTTGRRLQRPSGRPCWRRPSLWGWWPGGV